MEEFKTKKVLTSDISEVNVTESVFGWEAYDEEKGSYKSKIFYKRDNSMPYYQEITSYEKKWRKDMEPSPILSYIFLGVAVLFITVYLFLGLIFKGDDSLKLTFFLSLMVPGLAFFILGTVFSLLRIRKIQKNLPTYFERRREIKEKIEQLKNGN